MTVLITGANRGIGHQLYRQYEAAQTPVIGTSREGADPFKALDVTDEAAQAELAAKLDAKPLSLLVCNAGVYLDKGMKFPEYTPDIFAQSFAVHVTGVYLTVRNLLPNLQIQSGAKIAIISSQMASDTRAPGGSYAYRASKAAALNFGRNLAADLKGIGIAVGIYHPGWVQTDMGGVAAEITPEEAASGLRARFDALSLETTGCFETWDGRAHPY
ncbi:MAG: SDR family NAD(P)-dependent oxidoreductase [Paracoccaceae bacterium]